MIPKKFRAKSVEIHCDKVQNKPLNMETGNHEGQNRTVSKNVVLEIHVPISDKTDSELYPPKGSVIKADKANINAKRIFGPWGSRKFGRKQKKLMAEQDVTVHYKERGGSK